MRMDNELQEIEMYLRSLSEQDQREVLIRIAMHLLQDRFVEAMEKEFAFASIKNFMHGGF